jgi:hypothetical protein
MNNEILFSETQKFRQWWLWLIILGTNVIIILVLGGILKSDADIKDMSGTELFLVTLVGPVVSILFLIIPKLETRIQEDGIYVRFFPFHLSFRHYSWTDISKAYVRKYSPLREYGGWGIRFGFGNGKAFNVRGNNGLQIEFNNKRKLLIGTNKPEELEAVLKTIRRDDANG